MKHGHRGSGPRDRTKTYNSWRAMRQRCLDPRHEKYASYGGRGVKIHAEWDSYEIFLKDMGERPEGKTLDRVDPYGNYEPSNCRWATAKRQARNKRVKEDPAL